MPKTFATIDKMPKIASALAASALPGAVSLIVGLLSVFPVSKALAAPADAAASSCHGYYESTNTPSTLAANRNAQIAIQRCILLGVDPPLKARNALGTKPAPGVAENRLSGETCPPFSRCLVMSRDARGNLNRSMQQGTPSAPPPTRYSAPQFSGHLPVQWPQDLQGGGTIYIYDNVSVTPPEGALIYSNDSNNYYSDGAPVSVAHTHTAIPPAPNGNIMQGKYLLLGAHTKFNFDDGGIVVLPTGFNGIINGTNVSGGDIIIVNHAGDTRMPKGSRLYPFPSGSHSNGSHVGATNYQPYQGPQIVLPDSPKLVINDTINPCAPSCSEPVPGLSWF